MPPLPSLETVTRPGRSGSQRRKPPETETPIQATALVGEVHIENLFDTRDPVALSREGVDPAVLSTDTWRDEMKARGISRSQEIAGALASRSYHGLMSRSFARGNAANPDATNIVLWTWPHLPAHLRAIDDEGHLGALRSV